jgi:hypothetical protein
VKGWVVGVVVVDDVVVDVEVPEPDCVVVVDGGFVVLVPEPEPGGVVPVDDGVVVVEPGCVDGVCGAEVEGEFGVAPAARAVGAGDWAGTAGFEGDEEVTAGPAGPPLTAGAKPSKAARSAGSFPSMPRAHMPTPAKARL